MKRIFRFLFLVFFIYAGTNALLAQWVQTNGPHVNSVSGLELSGTYVFAGTERGVFLSTDNGTNWTGVNSGLNDTNVFCLAISGTNLFAGTFAGGIFLSSDSGTSWITVDSGLITTEVQAIAISGTNVFAGTAEGVFLSTNSGTTWRHVGLDTSTIWSLVVSGTDLFAGVTGSEESSCGVFRTTDSGASWTQVSTIATVRALAVSGPPEAQNLFAATDGDGVFLSTDRGTSWAKVNNNLTDTCVLSLAVYGPPGAENLLAGTWRGGVFLSTNSGANWTAVNDGFPKEIQINTFAVSDSFLYVGTAWADGVWKRSLSELVTSVKTLANNTPVHFRLSQNFPNPFNPTTTISFSLASKAFVSLKVFDVLGRQVALLRSEELPAGTHTQQWNAVSLPSGLYFYRLQVGLFTETKKLILLR